MIFGGSIGAGELIIILVIVLIVFGVGKLPDVGRGLGKGIKEFRQATKEELEGLKDEKEKEKEPAKLPEEKKE